MNATGPTVRRTHYAVEQIAITLRIRRSRLLPNAALRHEQAVRTALTRWLRRWAARRGHVAGEAMLSIGISVLPRLTAVARAIRDPKPEHRARLQSCIDCLDGRGIVLADAEPLNVWESI